MSTVWPSSPPSRSSLPSITTPPPTPVPSVSITIVRAPRPAPARYSASAAALPSFSSVTGRPTPTAATESSSHSSAAAPISSIRRSWESSSVGRSRRCSTLPVGSTMPAKIFVPPTSTPRTRFSVTFGGRYATPTRGVATMARRMSAPRGEKPYRVYRGGRVKGKVPTIPRPTRERGGDGDARRDYRGPGTKQPKTGLRGWSWKRWTALSVLVLLLVFILWTVAGYLSFRSGVKDANKRLPESARLALVPDKGNAAFQIGGARLAERTVQAYTGLPINHVVVVNFHSFAQLIDKLGGIDINVPQPILSNRFDCPYSTNARCERWKGWRFRKGMQHMSGYRALIYSRVRENQLNPADTDITRGARQQAVVQALMSKLSGAGTFFKLPFIGGDLMKPLATDLSPTELAQIGWLKFRAGTTLHCRLGGTGDGGYIDPSEDNAAVIAMVKGESAPQPPPPNGDTYPPGCYVNRLPPGG